MANQATKSEGVIQCGYITLSTWITDYNKSGFSKSF